MLKLSNLFSDHAVLQREMSIPVWGWTTPNTAVEATLDNGTAAAGFSGDDGKFLLRFPAQKAGGPFTLTVTTESGDQVVVTDLYIGEVWIAGGQSNMEMPLQGYLTPVNDVDQLTFGAPVRMLTVPRRTTLTRRSNVNAAWTLPTAADLRSWSATGAFFAARLSRELQVPVGIIASNWGGTIAEAWTSREMLIRNPEFAAMLQEYEEQVNTVPYWHSVLGAGLHQLADLSGDEQAARTIAIHIPEYPANLGLERNWQSPEFDDGDWGVAKLPGSWQSQALFADSGALWFRKRVRIPAKWANRRLVLEIGAADKHDVTYFNGEQVGATGCGVEICHWNVCRCYEIPPELAKAGDAVIAVRVYSFMFDGGLIGPAHAMRLRLAEDDEGRDAIPLAGEWRWQLELNLGNTRCLTQGLGNPNSFGILFDDMIFPLIPYAVRGAIWYQGESNAGVPGAYRRLMRDLITDWRTRWGQPGFAFYQVLLAGFADKSTVTWPELREAQILSAQDTDSGFASATDIGDAADIHPLNKRGVGERLALCALQETYGLKLEGHGPEIAQIQWDVQQVRIRFAHADGLRAGDGEPGGWEIAGANGKFVAAEVKISGDTVLVSADSVVVPHMVRYAWSGYPAEANLYNRAGLPMVPFQRKRQDI